MVESSNFNLALFPSYISVRYLYQNVGIALNGATGETKNSFGSIAVV